MKSMTLFAIAGWGLALSLVHTNNVLIKTNKSLIKSFNSLKQSFDFLDKSFKIVSSMKENTIK